MAVQLRKLLERTALYYPVLPDGTPGPAPVLPLWSPLWTQGAYLGPDETAVASLGAEEQQARRRHHQHPA